LAVPARDYLAPDLRLTTIACSAQGSAPCPISKLAQFKVVIAHAATGGGSRIERLMQEKFEKYPEAEPPSNPVHPL
jgi:hypothetical protein